MTELLYIFRALADPTRIRIVHLLGAMELAVGELAQVMAQSQPRVSRHVKILAEAGLIDRRKEGNRVFLRVTASPVTRTIISLFNDISETESEGLWLRADLAHLAAVRADRMRAADEYFARHAEHWDSIRSLHVPEAEVEQAMVDMLGTAPVRHFLDLGTGTGRMIELFAPYARQTSAIDRSADMLHFARTRVLADKEDSITLLLGDFCALPLADASVDLITAHQILHYAPTPELVIAEAARVLAHEGRMLIVDFAPHEREDLRTHDQHERLGFSDSQMESWFAESGLKMEMIRTLPGAELTVQLWLGRKNTA